MKKPIIVTLVIASIFAAGTFAGAALRRDRQDAAAAPKIDAEHAVLKRFEGEWDAVTSGMGAETKGTQSSKLACDGMFLMTIYHGEYMKQKFEGRGVMGYDAEAKKYQNLWVDSMTPKMAVDNGTWDEKTKTLAFESKGPDGSPSQMVFTFPDDSRYILRFIGKDKDGKDIEQFRITYTRQAAKPTPK